MEIQTSPLPSHSLEKSTTDTSGRRQRSVKRLKHEAEVQIFRNKVGDLEGIRESLGLRPTQMADLLRVHPSAWTRWTQAGQQAPPHIYQMLEWYLELQGWPRFQIKKTATTLPSPPSHV